MQNARRRTVSATSATFVALSLIAGCASGRELDLGAPADGRAYDRRVVVGTNTRFVNVDAGEVILFVVRQPDGTDRSFEWRFGIAHATVKDLKQLAPKGSLDRPVRVVVAPNPRF